MKNSTWKTKLSSRKFWAAIIAFVTALATAFGASALETNQLITVLSSFSVLVIYIVSETVVDAKNKTSILTLSAKEAESGVINTKIDWKTKLSSRKFWAALISFLATLLFAIGCDDMSINQVKAVITSLAIVCVYILGEGIIDGATPSDIDELLEDYIDSIEDATVVADKIEADLDEFASITDDESVSDEVIDEIVDPSDADLE